VSPGPLHPTSVWCAWCGESITIGLVRPRRCHLPSRLLATPRGARRTQGRMRVRRSTGMPRFARCGADLAPDASAQAQRRARQRGEHTAASSGVRSAPRDLGGKMPDVGQRPCEPVAARSVCCVRRHCGSWRRARGDPPCFSPGSPRHKGGFHEATRSFRRDTDWTRPTDSLPPCAQLPHPSSA
jgi:hypothetical protein